MARSLELLDKQTQGDLMVHWLQAGTGDDDKTISSTGRSPHAGDSMSARDLDGILSASERVGSSASSSTPIRTWALRSGGSSHSGAAPPGRKTSSGSYWPPDTPGPDTAWFSGHA